jgi:beta-galactosidase/beta-glucuronidase
VSFDPKNTPELHMEHPKLWWPNGYGKQDMYALHLVFVTGGKTSDAQDVPFGVRKITYAVADSDNLTISVNGVRVFIRGGDWGLDEAMKRIPRARLEAQIRMHQLANLNMIRNWVGQSTSEDFYELCDKYGILLWDEFFQANPNDGPDPEDLEPYVANVRDKILRFRNHPSIAVWCARNEGYPPKEIDDQLRTLMAELEPERLYQPSSTEGRGVKSSGPYRWRTPREFFVVDAPFKTEIGSVSVPTIESIRGMMPETDWETITDTWAERDFAKGASGGDKYPGIVAKRYGTIANLADFVRKSQMMNYEAFRAMYEGRNAQLFHPATGVLTWMSNPAQPSFVWQLYHYDLEPNASLFAVKKAAEPVHIQFNEVTGEVQVINNLPDAVEGAVARVAVYGLDGQVGFEHTYPVQAPADAATSVAAVEFPAGLSAVHFVQLELRDAAGKLLSGNFYWQAQPEHPDDLADLETMPVVTLEATARRVDADGRCTVSVTLHNPTKSVALMAHLQLRRRRSGERVLPVFASDNYVSLVGGETRTIAIDADLKALRGADALVLVDGWNVGVVPAAGKRVAVAPNVDAQVEHWPKTGLPFQTVGLR